MIADTIDNLKGAIYPAAFQKAFDFLKNLSPDIADGKYEIDGEKIYASVQSGDTRGTQVEKLEVHRKYIDIQYLFAGNETLVWAPEKGLSFFTPFDLAKDCGFLHAPAEITRIPLVPGSFAVFFPGDAHNGKISGPEGEKPFRKVVVKVDASLL